MGIVYPEAIDSFSVPSLPEGTSLSSAGTSTRTHTESHADLGLAIMALETNSSPLTHDHSANDGGGIWVTYQLDQANTHQNPDTDADPGSLHHTLGRTATQAAAGNHAHDYNGPDIFNKPLVVCTTTTRPADPFPGLMIWETDTNTMRVWSQFTANNILVTGIDATDNFGRISGVVTYDATGSGFFETGPGNTGTWDHAVGALATCMIVGVSNWDSGDFISGDWNTTVHVGTTAMTQIGVADTTLDGFVALFGLMNPPTGAQTITLSSTAGSFHPYLIANSVTYNNVQGWDNRQINSVIPLNGEIDFFTSVGNMVVGAFTNNLNQPLSNVHGATTRYNEYVNHGPNKALAIIDKPGAAPSVSLIASGAQAAVGVELLAAAGDLGADWALTYVVGSSPADGFMGTPSGDSASFVQGANATCRVIARRTKLADAVTQTDDQILTFVTGTNTIQLNPGHDSPSNDGYLRMSADESTYVRVVVNTQDVRFWWTNTGPSGEAFLGGVSAHTVGSKITWQIKASGSTYIVYQGGIQIGAIVDTQNVVAIGPDTRGWGMGMVATAGGTYQHAPSEITSIEIADQAYHTEGLIWQLLPVGSVPVLRAEAHFAQQIVAGSPGGITGFDTILEDWFYQPFMNVDVSQTDIVVPETGHYDVHAAIHWDSVRFYGDHALISVTVNGQDIGRKHWEFVRGNGFTPGFPQTNEIFFHYYFAAGDTLRINARHNAPQTCWLWFLDTSPDVQACWVEVVFRGA